MTSAPPAVLVIAEAGVNHNGQLDLALRLCDAARASGADAVKFQTFRAQDLAVRGAPTAQYQARQTGDVDQFEMLRKLELSEEDHLRIKRHCDGIGIEFFSTPFSVDAVDMLVRLGVTRIKLSSGELTPPRAGAACGRHAPAPAGVHRHGNAGRGARGAGLGAHRAGRPGRGGGHALHVCLSGSRRHP
jgi:hypothetical protein